MKQKLIITTTIFTLLVPVLVSAEENTGTSRPIPVRTLGELKDRAVEVRERVLERKASTTNRLIDRKGENIRKQLERVSGNATATAFLLDKQREFEARKASTTERMKEKLEEFKVRKASTTEKMREVRQEVAKRVSEKTADVLEATTERLNKLVERAESRIGKLKALGLNTSSSEGFVATTKTHISEAEASLQAFLSLDLSTENAAKENFQTIRDAARDVKTHLKEARESLMQALRALPRATSTATGTLE